MKNIHEQLAEQTNIVKALNLKLQEELEILDNLFYQAMKQSIAAGITMTIEKDTSND